MKTITRSCLTVAVILTAMLILPDRVSAYFERGSTSSRIQALGGAFVGISDDPAALTSNPAGLAGIPHLSFLSTVLRPYGISDLEESYFAAVIPAFIGNAGVSWHRFALRDVTTEDLITIGFGRDYIRTSQDASLSFGGTIDIARVSYAAPLSKSETKVTGSLGVLLRPFPIIGVGYAVRNIVEPDFDLVPGEGMTRLGRTHVWSVAYHWERKVSFVYDRVRDQDKVWRNRLGMEVRVNSVITIRSGLKGENVTGGVGIQVAPFKLDFAVSSHDNLGVSYVFSLGLDFPKKAGDSEYE